MESLQIRRWDADLSRWGEVSGGHSTLIGGGRLSNFEVTEGAMRGVIGIDVRFASGMGWEIDSLRIRRCASALSCLGGKLYSWWLFWMLRFLVSLEGVSDFVDDRLLCP